jgi:hypothetical protein
MCCSLFVVCYCCLLVLFIVRHLLFIVDVVVVFVIVFVLVCCLCRALILAGIVFVSHYTFRFALYILFSIIHFV